MLHSASIKHPSIPARLKLDSLGKPELNTGTEGYVLTLEKFQRSPLISMEVGFYTSNSNRTSQTPFQEITLLLEIVAFD